jgi:purine-binding chemotaxis protein CheW
MQNTPTVTTETFSAESQYVVFKIGPESYGIDIFRVNEIIRLRSITPVPGTPPYVKGLVNLRGKTVPIFDLSERLGMFADEQTDSWRIVILDGKHGLVGVIVHQVCEVTTLSGDNVDAAPPMTSSMNADLVLGVAKTEVGLITLLDMDKVLGE